MRKRQKFPGDTPDFKVVLKEMSLSRHVVENYDQLSNRQPYLLEIWA